MGKGGDLNNKKSWHPLRAANIHATQKAEAEAIAERKKLQARLEEIKEDRRVEELQRALEAAGGKVKPYDPKLAWMYSGPTDGQGGDAAEGEAYLLGKRRIDKLLQDNETKRLQKQSSQDNLLAGPTHPGPRDTAAKIREDPLLAMKKVEQQAYEALMNDPIRRRQLLASMGIEDTSSKSKEEDRRHKHRHHHHRSRHHRSRDEDMDLEDDRHSRKQRSGAGRERSRSPRRYDDAGDEKRSHRQRRDSRERSRSPRRTRDSNDESYARKRTRDRSPSPRRRDSGDSRRRARSRSPARQCSGDRDRGRDTRRQGWDGNRGGHSRSDARNDEEERARKLQAMQADASALDDARERRLAAIEQADKAAQEIDERARQRDKYKADRHFTASVHRQAADRSV